VSVYQETIAKDQAFLKDPCIFMSIVILLMKNIVYKPKVWN